MIGLRLPSRAEPVICPITVVKPAHTGADKLVPPMQHTTWPLSAKNTPGE